MLKKLQYCGLLVSFVVAGALGAQQPASGEMACAPEKTAQEMLGKFTQLKKDSSSVGKVFNAVIEKCKEPAIDVAQLLPCAIVVYALANVVNGYGHVAMSHILFDVEESLQVDVGCGGKLCKMGNLQIQKFPMLGVSVTGAGIASRNGWDSYETSFNVMHKFVGGAATPTFLYACITTICKCCTYIDGKPFPKITLKNILTGFSPFQTIVQTKALSITQKRFLLNLTFVMSTALFFQMLCAGIDSFKEMKSYIIDGLVLASFLTSESIVVKKYYDARKQLLYPVALQPAQ
jgi:hypothetical protein